MRLRLPCRSPVGRDACDASAAATGDASPLSAAAALRLAAHCAGPRGAWRVMESQEDTKEAAVRKMKERPSRSHWQWGAGEGRRWRWRGGGRAGGWKVMTREGREEEERMSV